MITFTIFSNHLKNAGRPFCVICFLCFYLHFMFKILWSIIISNFEFHQNLIFFSFFHRGDHLMVFGFSLFQCFYINGHWQSKLFGPISLKVEVVMWKNVKIYFFLSGNKFWMLTRHLLRTAQNQRCYIDPCSVITFFLEVRKNRNKKLLNKKEIQF